MLQRCNVSLRCSVLWMEPPEMSPSPTAQGLRAPVSRLPADYLPFDGLSKSEDLVIAA